MGANSSSPEGLDNYPDHRARRIEESPFQLLTVRILRARNIQKADIFTESDCYVCLWLPTASSEKVRTITIPNSKNPVWNQAFCYRIDKRVKNILHLKVCDEDTFTKDDHLYTVLFDIAKLHPGQTSRVNFKLNEETQEQLDVEFSLQYMGQRQGGGAHTARARTAGARTARTHTAGTRTARAPASEGILALGSRWISWFRSIDIPRPPGF